MVSNVELTNILVKLTLAIQAVTVLGSIFSLVIFSRRAFEKSSIGFYCRLLAFFDLYVLIVMVLVGVGQIIGVQIIASTDIGCQVSFFLGTAVSPIQGWILIVFSIDQLIAVSMTDRFGFVKKPWFKYSISIFIFLFNCAIYSPTFIFVRSTKMVFGNVTAAYRCDSLAPVVSIIYLAEASFIPFFIMIIITFQIVRILIRSRNRTLVQPFNSSNSKTLRRRDFKFAFNSVILNMLFIILTTPLIVYYLVPIKDFILSNLFNTACFVFFYLNYALHFWVHLIVNAYFRNELLVLFRIRRDRRTSIMMSLTLKNN